MQGAGERLLATAGRALQQDRHLLGEQLVAAGQGFADRIVVADIFLMHIHARIDLDLRKRFGSARRRRAERIVDVLDHRCAYDGEETTAERDVAHGPDRAGFPARALLERCEVELEQIGYRLAD